MTAIYLTLAAVALWMAAALGAALLPERRWRRLALLATGVPLLGWVTLLTGPATGLVCFGLGAALMWWRPSQPAR